MRRLIIFLFFLIVSVWLGLVVLNHPGYLLISYKPWLIQTPLWFALLSFLLILGLFYFIVSSIDQCHFIYYRFKNWLRFRREHQSFSKTQQGLIALIEGRYKKAEKFLLAGLNQTIEPLINYLGAAKAAHELDADARSVQYLKKALLVAPSAHLAIGLTRAELALSENNLESAAITLNELKKSSPYHPGILRLLEKTYVRASDFKNLLTLIPQLRKSQLINKDEARTFEKNMYLALLHQQQHDLRAMNELWQKMPKYLHQNTELIKAYVHQLLHFNEAKAAEEIIRGALKRQYDADLLLYYSNLPFPNLNRQLVIVGAWLKMYGPRSEILLTLGKLCVARQLWGKAKDYFTRCLLQGPNSEASLQYGKLLEQLGETEAALAIYRKGLEQCQALPLAYADHAIHCAE